MSTQYDKLTRFVIILFSLCVNSGQILNSKSLQLEKIAILAPFGYIEVVACFMYDILFGGVVFKVG